ncbi:type II toxin-antitoxin system RelE/ParE family toxin [Clostridium sp. 19966]|uniref:type II toxin-antitoxin system RelE/ParE family toxin n=1 Tax=Clostridium sp. 19966 TaxID=2768166 RepID=UPI0028DF0273|nr:type II toxin-antitoxin system RelE/ParE family toxin [Clostridium sp. 19966]MDT8718596.1 type II toxin-antitoxin system RelE/ParE family toxin [Clostridium sp. 19966]
MTKVEYSPMALEDLKNIRDYILTNFGDNTAKQVLKKITSDIRKLEQYPVLGVDLGNIIDVPTEYRYIFSEKNYIFYHLEFDKIRIVRVLNEKQDYIKQLFGIMTGSDEEN